MRDSVKGRVRKRERETEMGGRGWYVLMKRVSVVTLMQFLSRSLRSLSPALDNELVNTLPPPPLGLPAMHKRLRTLFLEPLFSFISLNW